MKCIPKTHSRILPAINCTKQSPFWAADRHTASQKFLLLLRVPNFHYCVYERTPLISSWTRLIQYLSSRSEVILSVFSSQKFYWFLYIIRQLHSVELDNSAPTPPPPSLWWLPSYLCQSWFLIPEGNSYEVCKRYPSDTKFSTSRWDRFLLPTSVDFEICPTVWVLHKF
jgi:hypothetical protein